MRYKTTIEVVMDAESRTDAMLKADERLSGNISFGKITKCYAMPVRHNNGKFAVIAVLSILLIVSALSAYRMDIPSRGAGANTASLSAIQPPLKTSRIDKDDKAFKKTWMDKQLKESLARITK